MTSLLNRRYAMHSLVGKGSFGKVLKCIDIYTRETVAIKMLKIYPRKGGYPEYREVAMLMKVRRLNRDNLVQFHHYFLHQGHFCLVFEVLDMSLFDLMKMRDFRPFSVMETRPIIQQLLVALKALKEAKIIHCDIKPENVMLVNQKKQPFKVKLIDFGLAITVSEAEKAKGLKMQTRYYRSPEVLLGLPISHKIDTWSLGCVMASLVMGQHLYPGRCEYDVMRFIILAQGMPPQHLLDAGLNTSMFYTWDYVWRLKTPKQYYYETGVKPSDARGYNFSSLDDMMKVGPEMAEDEVMDMIVFMVLMKNMLHLDATQRLGPSEALEHPFISMSHLVQGTSSYVKASVQTMRVCTRETMPSSLQRPDCNNITYKGVQQRLEPSEALEHPSYVKASVQSMRICTRETMQSSLQRPDITYKGVQLNPNLLQHRPKIDLGLQAHIESHPQRFVSRRFVSMLTLV